jgi:hypothetical protein
MSKSFEIEAYCSIDSIEYNKLKEKVKDEYPNDKRKRIEYAKSIMPGQVYIFYLADIFQRATIECAYPTGVNNGKQDVIVSTDAVETLLRAMFFMIEHMHDGLPEHNYNYIISKSSTFFDQLFKQVEEYVE